MLRRPPLAVVAFAVFTVFVWGQRIVNIAGPAGGSAFDLARAVAFVVAGVVVAIAAVRSATTGAQLERVVGVAATLTTVSWVVQVALILGRDRSVGFVVVHVVLAVVFIGLAGWAVLSVRRSSLRNAPPAAVPSTGRAPADVGS